MSPIDTQLVSMESDTLNANIVKLTVIEKLFNNGVITEEQADEYTVNWNIVIVKRSWFKRFFGIKNNEGDEKGYIYRYVNFKN